jgi:hypothetical protein
MAVCETGRVRGGGRKRRRGADPPRCRAAPFAPVRATERVMARVSWQDVLKGMEAVPVPKKNIRTSSLASSESSLDKLCGARELSPYICQTRCSHHGCNYAIIWGQLTYARRSLVKPDAKLLLLNMKSPIFVAVRRMVFNVPIIDEYSFLRCLQLTTSMSDSLTISNIMRLKLDLMHHCDFDFHIKYRLANRFYPHAHTESG